LTIPTGALGFAVGLLVTGIYPVVIRGSDVEKTGIALAVTVVMRNTAVSVGVAAAFAIVEGAGLAGAFPADTGFVRVFVIGAIGAAAALVMAFTMPGRRQRSAAAPA
jgi:hypothetical protein